MVVSPICCSVSPSWSKLIGNTGGGGRKGDEGWRVDRCSGQESGAETDFGACITVRRCRGSCFSLRKAKPRRSLWNTEQRDKMIVDNGAAAGTSRHPLACFVGACSNSPPWLTAQRHSTSVVHLRKRQLLVALCYSQRREPPPTRSSFKTSLSRPASRCSVDKGQQP